MRALFILSFIANVILTLVSLAILPSRVAIHFGWNGMADGWAPSYVYAIIFLGTEIFLFCCLFLAPRFMFVFPDKWLNLPNKRYWLEEENKPRMKAIVASMMWEFGIAMFVFLFIVIALTIQANLSDPVRLNEKVFLADLVLFLFYVAYWCTKWFWAFRTPTEGMLRT